jgi:hypothetical protein
MAIFAKKPPPTEPPATRGNNMDFDLDEDTSAGVVQAPAHRGPSGPAQAYGIADAIQLMRSLPTEGNVDLVTRVVRVTLGSVNVRLEDIIEDAGRRQKAIQDRIAGLHGQIGELEEQLEARRREITTFEADLKETTAVKERLILAEKSAGHGPAAAANQPPPPPPPPSSRLSTLPRASDRE